MIRSYSVVRRIQYSDCDMFGRIKPSAVFCLLQSAAVEHSFAVGSPLVKPRGGTAMWVVARTYYKFDRPVTVNEKIFVHTAIRMPLGFAFYRDYEFYDESGQQIGMATSIWALTDRNTKRNVGVGISAGLKSMTKISGSLKSNRITRFRFPSSMAKTAVYTFTNSDLDMNGHVANVRYGDIAFDSINLDIYRHQFISELQINYNVECRRGETIDIFTGRDDVHRYIRGSVDSKVRFEVKMRLLPC